VVALFLAELLDKIAPDDLQAEWEPVDDKEPMALMVKGSRKILDDQFPEGDDWAFLGDLDAFLEGAPTTPTKDGDGSFAFGSPPARSPPPRNMRPRDHGKQLRPPASAHSEEESESADSDDDEDNYDSGDSGPPPSRPRQPAAPDAGLADIARVLARHKMTMEDCKDPEKFNNNRKWKKPDFVNALCELVTGGHVAKAPEGGVGPGASINPVETAVVGNITKAMNKQTKAFTKQSVQFSRVMIKQTDAMVRLHERTVDTVAVQAEKQTEGFVRFALGFKSQVAPNAIEGEIPIVPRASPSLSQTAPLCSCTLHIYRCLSSADEAQPPSLVLAEQLPRVDSGESSKKRKGPSSRFEEVEVPKKASSQERSGDKN
jgi:hypothetical protein